MPFLFVLRTRKLLPKWRKIFKTLDLLQHKLHRFYTHTHYLYSGRDSCMINDPFPFSFSNVRFLRFLSSDKQSIQSGLFAILSVMEFQCLINVRAFKSPLVCFCLFLARDISCSHKRNDKSRKGKNVYNDNDFYFYLNTFKAHFDLI